MLDYFFDYLLLLDNKKTLNNQGFLRAADGNRTRDLRTTNATLYRLCYSSLFPADSFICLPNCIVSQGILLCQYTFAFPDDNFPNGPNQLSRR